MTLRKLDSFLITTSPLIADGYLTLWKDGQCVYAGPACDQIRGLNFDEIMLSPSDEERLAEYIEEQGGKLTDIPLGKLS